MVTVSDDLKDAGLVGFAHIVGGEAGHQPVVQVGLGYVGQLAAGAVDGELGMLDVSLEKLIAVLRMVTHRVYILFGTFCVCGYQVTLIPNRVVWSLNRPHSFAYPLKANVLGPLSKTIGHQLKYIFED